MHSYGETWKPSERTASILKQTTVTPEDIRDVMEECFTFAHGDIEQAVLILQKQAADIGMWWSKPDCVGMAKLIPKLEEVASQFRNPELILQNRLKIQNLLRKCCV